MTTLEHITKSNQSLINVKKQTFHFTGFVHCIIIMHLQCFKQSTNT